MNKTENPLQYNLKDFIERIGEILLPEIDNNVSVALLQRNDEYRELHCRRMELQQQYSCIQDVLDNEGAISLNEKEHQALVEYLTLISKAEYMLREQLYFCGHADSFSYLRKIGVIAK